MKYVEEGKANNDGSSIINFQAFSGHMKKKGREEAVLVRKITSVPRVTLGRKNVRKKKC